MLDIVAWANADASFNVVASLFLINVSAHWFRNYIFDGPFRILIWSIIPFHFIKNTFRFFFLHFWNQFFFSVWSHWLTVLDLLIYTKNAFFFLFLKIANVFIIKRTAFQWTLHSSSVSHRSDGWLAGCSVLADVFFSSRSRRLQLIWVNDHRRHCAMICGSLFDCIQSTTERVLNSTDGRRRHRHEQSLSLCNTHSILIYCRFYVIYESTSIVIMVKRQFANKDKV